MYEIISVKTHYDFLGKRKLALAFSLLMTALCVYIWIARGPDKFGVDFRGGHEFVVDFKPDVGVSTEAIQEALALQKMEGVRVQFFGAAGSVNIGSSNQYSIRLSNNLTSSEAKTNVESALKPKFADKFQIVRTDSVGPTIGNELKQSALLAVILGLLGICLYVAVRFEFSYALGALVALFHDVTIALGVYLAFGHDLNMASVAAALTILGYSVNDTIVVFDRIREEVRKQKSSKFNLEKIMNEAINICLSRTIVTTLSTLFVVGTLLVLGGGEIADLSLFLFAGMVCGAYSTIYIASPVVLWWETRNKHARA